MKEGVTDIAENVQLTIPPNYAAKFNIQLNSLKYDFSLLRVTVSYSLSSLFRIREEQAKGYIYISAPSSEHKIPITYRSVEGSLSFSPLELHFDFPAKDFSDAIPVFSSSTCR